MPQNTIPISVQDVITAATVGRVAREEGFVFLSIVSLGKRKTGSSPAIFCQTYFQNGLRR